MDALTEAQRTSLRQSLDELEREMGSRHETTAEGAAPVDLDEPIGRISRMDEMQRQQMVQANRAALQLRLQRVRGALRRFEDDEYGLCVTCGEEIGYRRLSVQPEAPFCVACQSRREERS